MTAPLLLERRGRVLVLTLNRPARHNALNPELVCRLDDAWAEFATDEALHVAVVTGAGEETFCAGGDLETMLPLLSGARAAADAWDARIVSDPETAMRGALKGLSLDKPVIAAVNGTCLAGGMEMMLGTDLCVAAENARFGLPEVRHGLIPFAGALVRLPRRLPEAVAMELLLTGGTIPAARAHELGLVNRLVAPERVLPEALEMAERIAANGPLAVRAIKRVLRMAAGRPEETGFALETAAMQEVMATTDAREGPAAFMERRKPDFRGQ